MMDKYSKYRVLIKQRQIFVYFSLIGPIVLGLLSIWIDENTVFFFVAFYFVVVSLWALILFFSSLCPQCNGLFFWARYDERGVTLHKFLLNDNCNQCGFPESGTDEG